MGIQQVFTGAAGRKEEWIFYHIKHFHSILVVSFTSSGLFYPSLGNQTTRLQRDEEPGLMSQTSEDAPSVIQEV